jgi:hypothetical protein
MTKKKTKNLLEQRRADEVEDLITQSEAAELSGRSLASINNLVRRGRLRSKEVFGKKLVYRSEVLAFEKEKPGPKTEEK